MTIQQLYNYTKHLIDEGYGNNEVIGMDVNGNYFRNTVCYEDDGDLVIEDAIED